jgi:hypothetical protein
MKLNWDKIGERFYENGVRYGVLYPQNKSTGLYPLGVAWNGLTAVTESPSGAEANPKYADDIKYLNLISAEEFGATIEAYTYPDEFAACDGSAELAPGVMIGQQKRQAFGLSYRTILGNDIEGEDHGYKLHLVYGGIAAPSEKGYNSLNESPDAITFSWEVTTTPVAVPGFRPTASLTIDSTKVSAENLAILEGILYGSDVADPRLPLPDEVAAIFEGAAPSAIALSTIVPDDEAVGVAVDANIVLTFNNKIASEAIIVTDAIGGIVAATKTWDATGKILTINPNTNLTNNTLYIVTIGGVVDIYGRHLPRLQRILKQ